MDYNSNVAGGSIAGSYRADPEQARKRAYESAAQCEAENKERAAMTQNKRIYTTRQERVIAASQRLFAARERINMLGMMAIPADRDSAIKQQIEFDLAQAELFQAEHDLARAKQPT